MKYLLLLLLMVFATNATAGKDTYTCETLQSLSWSANRAVEGWPPTYEDGLKIGEYPDIIRAYRTFTVSRISGQIIGGPFDTQGLSPSVQPEVRLLDSGDSEYSFRVVITFPNDTMVLTIHEWWNGPDKPFVGMGTLKGVFTGVCR